MEIWKQKPGIIPACKRGKYVNTKYVPHTVHPKEVVQRQGPPQLTILKVTEKSTRFISQLYTIG